MSNTWLLSDVLIFSNLVGLKIFWLKFSFPCLTLNIFSCLLATYTSSLWNTFLCLLLSRSKSMGNRILESLDTEFEITIVTMF